MKDIINPYFLTNKDWYKRGENGYELTDKATPEAIKSYNEYMKDDTPLGLEESIKMLAKIKELEKKRNITMSKKTVKIDDRPFEELTDEEKNEQSLRNYGVPYHEPTAEEIEDVKRRYGIK